MRVAQLSHERRNPSGRWFRTPRVIAMTPSITPLLVPAAVWRPARARCAPPTPPICHIGVPLDPDLSTIIAQVATGDQTAFAALYDQLAPTLFGVIRRVLRDPSQAEEVTQEVFVEIWKQAARFDGERGSVRTWAVESPRRLSVDHPELFHPAKLGFAPSR